MPATENESLRDLLTGFNSMKSALGLLPVNTGASPMGVGLQQAPPPPQVLHPGEAAVAAMQRHDSMVQQTLQSAQITRYQPPPSAPTPSIGGGMNPFVASALGGSGMGLPSPAMMTPPAFGMFRPPMGGPPMAGGPARMPSVFNPMTAMMPSPHFALPGGYGVTSMQARESQVMGGAAGATHFGMGVGGAALGGAIGSVFGPLGTVLGGLAGGGLGQLAGGMMTSPVVQDIARGRMAQAVTGQFMSSGAFLNPTTGQGLSRTGGLEVARGIRNMTHDVDFERTGFNTQDALRIMSQSAQNGLLTGAQSPEQIISKVKEVSKAVKMLAQVTGDPDVRHAIESLGQMRNLGFMGLGAQAGAVANQALFARMAGVSTGAMGQTFGMPGAMMAQQVGLAGATGFNAGLAGGGMGNVAVSSGALNDLQVGRAGGRAGVGQIATQAGIAAMDNPLYMAAALTRGPNGQLSIDPGAWRRAQTMDLRHVAQLASQRMSALGVGGIQELYPQMGELKDRLAQQINPMEMTLASIQQARGMMRTGAADNMGAAFMSMGMDATSARTMGRMADSPEFYEGLQQQLRAQRRFTIDQQRAERAQFDQPRGFARMGRQIRGGISAVGGAIASPFRAVAGFISGAMEESEAASYGERIRRFSEGEIIHDAAEERMMRGAFGAATAGGRDVTTGGGVPTGGVAEVRARLLAASTGGGMSNPFAGSSDDAMSEVRGIQGAGRAMEAGRSMSVAARVAVVQKLNASTGGRGQVTMDAAVANFRDKLNTRALFGKVAGASAVTINDARQAYIEGRTDKAAAAKEFDSDPSKAAYMFHQAWTLGTDEHRESLSKSVDLAIKAGAIDLTGSRDNVRAVASEMKRRALGDAVGDVSDADMAQAGAFAAHHTGAGELEVAAVVAAEAEGRDVSAAKAELMKKYGDKYASLHAAATDEIGRAGKGGRSVLAALAGGGAGIAERAKALRLSAGATKAAASIDVLTDWIQNVGGDVSKGGLSDQLKSISQEALDKMDPKTRALVEAGARGDKDALSELTARKGARQTEVRSGASVSSDLDALSNKVQEMKDATGAGDLSPAEAVQEKGMEVFGAAVDTFAKAVEKFAGQGEAADLAKANAWVQSAWGGGAK